MDDAASQVATNLEQQRALLYASLLQFAPETAPLRERVLDQVVLGALLGSDSSNPYLMGQVQRNLVASSRSPAFRTKVIEQSLVRLEKAGKVQFTKVEKRRAYYLPEGAAPQLERAIKASEKLFDSVLRKLLEGTEPLVKYEIAAGVCKNFICECFARFGAHLAKSVTGQISTDDLTKMANIGAAFDAAAKDAGLSRKAWKSVEARCVTFLQSKEPIDAQLKFQLTQGFYFTQLLGLRGAMFVPIGDEAFRQSVFYVDTNVLMVGLFPHEGMSQLFDELVGISKQIGIELRVSRATINETRRVVADHVGNINAILKFPEKVIHRTRDHLVSAFMEARRTDSELTPEMFFGHVDRLSETLAERWEIGVDERTEDDTLDGLNLAIEGEVIQEETLAIRGLEKSSSVLQHDLCLYALVRQERNTGTQKTWLLTLDRALSQAAARLKSDSELPFCFSLIGLLHSLSPYLVTGDPDHYRNVASVFSALLTEQVMTTDRLYSLRELVMLGQWHQDVLSTPETELLQALDYVNTTVLSGKPYKDEDSSNVALGLRSFIATSADDRRRELEAQAARLTAEAERDRATAAEQRRELQEGLEEAAQEISELNDTCDTLSSEVADLRRELEQAQGLAESLGEQMKSAAQRERDRKQRTREGLLILFGLTALLGRSRLLSFIDQPSPVSLSAWGDVADVLLRVVGALSILIPTAMIVKRVDRLEASGKQAALICATLLVAYFADIFHDPISFGSAATVATLLATIMIAWRGTKTHPG